MSDEIQREQKNRSYFEALEKKAEGIADGKVDSSEVIDTNGTGHGGCHH